MFPDKDIVTLYTFLRYLSERLLKWSSSEFVHGHSASPSAVSTSGTAVT